MNANCRGRAYWLLVAPLVVGVSTAAAGTDLLVDAAKRQDRQAVRTLVEQQVDVNAAEADGATALHWAAHWNDVETAALLLRAGANANRVNDYGVTPLALACTNASDAMVETLLAAGADATLARATGETPLMTCARTGNVANVRALLGAGADVNVAEPAQAQTALMWALSAGHTAIARTLVEAGADVHARSTLGFTPLMFAARMGDDQAVRMLLAAGAGLNDLSEDGATPLLVATVRGHTAVALLLLDRGADPNTSGTGYAPLHWAAGTWWSELTGPNGIAVHRDAEWNALAGLPTDKLLLVNARLAHGADTDVRVEKEPPRAGYSQLRLRLGGATPFLLAAEAADVAVMRALAEGGADTALGTDDNTTPLMAAAGVGRNPAESRVTEPQVLEAVTLALELGNDITAANDRGETVLHAAANLKWNRLVQFLVDEGAPLNAVRLRPSKSTRAARGCPRARAPGTCCVNWARTRPPPSKPPARRTACEPVARHLRQVGNSDGIRVVHTATEGLVDR
jgi:ankyrin repeat protein